MIFTPDRCAVPPRLTGDGVNLSGPGRPRTPRHDRSEPPPRCAIARWYVLREGVSFSTDKRLSDRDESFPTRVPRIGVRPG